MPTYYEVRRGPDGFGLVEVVEDDIPAGIRPFRFRISPRGQTGRTWAVDVPRHYAGEIMGGARVVFQVNPTDDQEVAVWLWRPGAGPPQGPPD
jgi:hypothetical protein